MDEKMETVGDRIKAARHDLGMRQVELADLIHVTERTMQAYESDEVVPFRKLQSLSGVLDRPIAWILHGDKATAEPGEIVPLLQEILGELKKLTNGTGKAPAKKPARGRSKAS